MRCLLPIGLFASIFVLAPTAGAQWLNFPTAGIPRTADGKPNLKAPAPKTRDGKPDFSGMWQPANRLPCNGVTLICGDLPASKQFLNIGAENAEPVPYRPESLEKMKSYGLADDPYLNCITPGGPRMHLLPTMKKVIQTPGLMAILDEYNASYRQIFLDGRPFPEDPQPSYAGYSVGKWAGETLVVESLGYRDDQWLDVQGSPLTNAAKVTERFRRLNFGSLEIEVTIEDLKAYTKPWTFLVKQDAVLDTEMLDAICLENEKDAAHMKKLSK
ncbi:MAG: hypothetical protein ABL967_17040 [Bryobacteraceae bacterium]